MGRTLTKSTTKKRAPTAAKNAKPAARNAKTMAAGATGAARRKTSGEGGGGDAVAESRPARKRAPRT